MAPAGEESNTDVQLQVAVQTQALLLCICVTYAGQVAWLFCVSDLSSGEGKAQGVTEDKM